MKCKICLVLVSRNILSKVRSSEYKNIIILLLPMINIKYQSDDEDLVTRLLRVRGLETEQAQLDFLSPSFKNARHSPRGLSDMDKAVVRIIHAIENQEKIMIF
jgi:hypothetical protein